MPIPSRKYRDLDLDFTAHPVTGQLPILEGADAVRRAVRNLVLTSNYERYHRPWIGSIVQNSLFMPASPVTEAQIRQSVEDVIYANEPRVESIVLVEVSLNLDLRGYDCDITFTVKNLPQPITLTLFLKRTR